jgi:hypothetical protein
MISCLESCLHTRNPSLSLITQTDPFKAAIDGVENRAPEFVAVGCESVIFEISLDRVGNTSSPRFGGAFRFGSLSTALVQDLADLTFKKRDVGLFVFFDIGEVRPGEHQQLCVFEPERFVPINLNGQHAPLVCDARQRVLALRRDLQQVFELAQVPRLFLFVPEKERHDFRRDFFFQDGADGPQDHGFGFEESFKEGAFTSLGKMHA